MQAKNRRLHEVFHALQAFDLPVQQMQRRLQALELALQEISPAKQPRFAPALAP